MEIKKIVVKCKKTGKVYNPEVEFEKIMKENVDIFKRLKER